MPGRQSTGPPSLQKPKPKKFKAKRSLNALAIAEKIAPVQKEKKQHRLGEIEDRPVSKRKREDDDESTDEETSKRSKRTADKDDENAEIDSDSSGNEWMTGKVDDEDDSELDSDEAFGESDDERFEGYTFRGGSSAPTSTREPANASSSNGKRSSDVDDDGMEGVDEFGEEEDAFGEDGVDLADVLDAEGQSGRDDSGSENDDNNSDTRSVLSMSDEDDWDDASKLASLQGMVDSMQKKDEAPTLQRQPGAFESMPPSEFGVTSKRKLTVADIMSTITDPALKKSLKHLVDAESSSKAQRKDMSRKLEAPLPKRQQDRIDRKAAYDKSKETLDRWVDTVKHNRRAEHLQFPLRDPDASVPQGKNQLLPLAESKPLSELEGAIQKIMQDSGLMGADGKLSESQIQASEELKTNKMPIQEVLARRAELRKQRDLLFREEVRAKRIKKIKSKTYRKIHRKERERNAAQIQSALQADKDVDSESEKERNDRRRAEERMGQKHRESKWAKGMKGTGRTKWDDDAKDGILEMARRDEELRRRMEGKQVRGEDDSDSDEDESESDDEGGGAVGAKARLPSRIQGLLNGNDSDGQPRSKLSEMAFMKRAQANQKDQNNAELLQLQKEANGEDSLSESEASEGTGRQAFGPQKPIPSISKMPTTTIQRSDFEEPELSGEEAPSKSKRRAEVDIDRVTIDTGRSVNDFGPTRPIATLAKVQTTQGSWNNNDEKNAPSSKSSPADVLAPKPIRSALKGARAAESAQNGERKIEQSINLSKATNAASTGNLDDGSESDNDPIVMTNADLARRAFAGDDVLDKKFQEEKDKLTKEQDDQIIDTSLPGWGSWTGLGVSKKASRPRARHREIKKVDGVAAANRKDAKLKDVIISEKRIKKNGKYLASQLPHPFETRAQYERSLRLPVGPEWTTKETFQGMTKPRVLMKQGVIAPMVKPIL